MFKLTKAQYDAHVMDTYARFDVDFVRGEGCTLYDAAGKAYLDFASGIGVNSVGYGHPAWVDAVAKQAAALAHVSNLYYTGPGGRLAERLTALSGLETVFFSNSGAEANEGMIKCARKASADTYGDWRHTIVTLRDSFHGRTLTTLAATGQDVFHQRFHPLTEGFIHVPRGDIGALKRLGGDVCAVMLEIVQGEGGVLPCPQEYLQQVAALCAERDWLLCVDEVQTGVGRCGSFFAFQKMGLKPDLVSFAKGIAGGLPFGGFLAGQRAARTLRPGDHATTFGGNPVCCAAALATLDILDPVLGAVDAKGAFIRERILAMNLPAVNEVRGLGLMLGVSVQGAPRVLVQKLLDAGLVCLTAGGDAIRLLPPLVISFDDLERGLAIFEEVVRNAS